MTSGCNPEILGRFITYQTLFHAAPDQQWLAEVLCKSVAELPGVGATALYIEGRCLSHFANPGFQSHWPATCPDDCSNRDFTAPGPLSGFPLQTAGHQFGCFYLAVADADRLFPYLVHLENGLGLVALLIANQTQNQQLQNLMNDLEGQVQRKVREITARDQREQQIQAARIRLNDYAAQHGSSQVMTRFLDEAEHLTQSTIGFFHFVEADQTRISLQTWSTNTSQHLCRMAPGTDSHYPVAQAGIWADCIRLAAPVVHNDYPNHPQRKGLPEGHAPLLRELAVPVLRGARVVAALGVGNKATDYTAEDIDTLQRLADLAWETVLRKKSEEAHQESEQRFKSMFGSHNAVMLLIDPAESRIIDANRAALAFYGYSPEQFRQMSLSDINSLPQSEIAAAQGRALHHEQNRFEFKHRLANGEIRDVEVHVSPITVREQTLLFSIIHDITERNRLLAELRRSSQLAALGTVAAGVAHEVNNPLQGIINYAALIARATDSSARAKEFANRIIHEGNRITGITRSLLHYSRDNHSEFVACDICQLIRSAVNLLQLNMKHESVSFGLKLPAEPVLMTVVPQGIQQIVINLIDNARDAVAAHKDPGRGMRIELEGRLEPGAGRDLFIIEVRDNGIGIPQEILPKVGDAFFTTKGASRGTGLGLSIVGDILRNHHGSMTIDSSPGVWTRVRISIPDRRG